MTLEVPTAPNPAGGLAIQELRRLRQDFMQLVRATEGKTEDMFFLPILTTQRIQASKLVVFPNNSAVYVLRIGSWGAIPFETQGGGILEIPLPRTIDSGIAVQLFTAAGAEVVYGPAATEIYSAYLIGTAEEAPLQAPSDANLIDG